MRRRWTRSRRAWGGELWRWRQEMPGCGETTSGREWALRPWRGWKRENGLEHTIPDTPALVRGRNPSPCGRNIRVCRRNIRVCRRNIRVCRRNLRLCGRNIRACRRSLRVCGRNIRPCRRNLRPYRRNIRACRKTPRPCGGNAPNLSPFICQMLVRFDASWPGVTSIRLGLAAGTRDGVKHGL